MKRNYIAAAVCILSLAACSKAELGEGVSAPKGEAVTLTVPQTKVALAGNYLDFEGDETIYAVAENGSTATLSNSSSTPGTFTGVFSEPVDGSTISLYYNQASVDKDGTAAYAQNGKPWLQALNNKFDRTGGQISLSAILAAPTGVSAVAVATDGTGIETIEFHSKNGTAISSFDGKAFSGDSSVSQPVLENKTSDPKNCNIFYVPEGMEGGYWIKAVKDGQAMYKSYSSSTAVTQDAKVTIKDFVASSVKLDVQLSGFPTSYSYYVANEEGSGITSKDVAKANATANDWIGDGKATYTITREGIPSTLLKFESFKLTVDGKEFTGNESDKTITYGDDDCYGHTTWGQKDIVATVTYTNLATGAPETESKTLTRHITGLPYKETPPSSTYWSKSSGKVSFDSGYMQLGVPIGGAVASSSAATMSFHVPADINVAVNSDAWLRGFTMGKILVTEYKTDYTVKINGQNVISENSGTIEADHNNLSGNGTLTSGAKSVECKSSYGAVGSFVRVKSISIQYR